MPSDIGIYTPLKTVVSYFLDEMGKGIADFDRAWILGLRALTTMTFDVSGQPITIRIPVSANKTVTLPSNCLQWSKIGILNERYEVEALRINPALSTYRENSPERIQRLVPDTGTPGAPSILFNNFYYGGECYHLFGIGNGIITHGECRVDEANGVIVLPPDFAYDSIILEFIDCPEKNYDYQIFTCMQEAVIAFIKWKLKAGSAQEYYDAVTIGRRSLPRKRVHLQKLNQVLRDSDGFKLKA